MVKMYVQYTSHDIHLLLTFIEIDEISVNLLHNYCKSDCHHHKDVFWQLVHFDACCTLLFTWLHIIILIYENFGFVRNLKIRM